MYICVYIYMYTYSEVDAMFLAIVDIVHMEVFKSIDLWRYTYGKT